MSLSPGLGPFHFPWVVLSFEMSEAFGLAKSECLNFIIGWVALKEVFFLDRRGKILPCSRYG